MSSPYEVVQLDNEWCLRVKDTQKVVAWSKKNDAAFKSYVAEAEKAAESRWSSGEDA